MTRKVFGDLSDGDALAQVCEDGDIPAMTDITHVFYGEGHRCDIEGNGTARIEMDGDEPYLAFAIRGMLTNKFVVSGADNLQAIADLLASAGWEGHSHD
jgi:hypothetical protein